MKYQAVIFDLFGTLIRNITVEEYEVVLRRMATVLSAPQDDFARLWHGTFNHRCTGILKSPEENIEYVCRELGVSAEDGRKSEAARMRYEQTIRMLIPLPGAIETLRRLRAEGYKTGLVTDCSEETPSIWNETPFAHLFGVTIFSCRVGLKKPDPRIYYLAAEGLGVMTGACLYVGDGSSNELTGASTVGMHAVLIRDPQEESGVPHRVEAETERWKGPVITSLEEVLELVK
ncbi:MAG: HAD-IA family hydrolase [Chloroflexi bacterium]|nr:HAD-IA family hydrolase [Chloroflexota bacterium]